MGIVGHRLVCISAVKLVSRWKKFSSIGYGVSMFAVEEEHKGPMKFLQCIWADYSALQYFIIGLYIVLQVLLGHLSAANILGWLKESNVFLKNELEFEESAVLWIWTLKIVKATSYVFYFEVWWIFWYITNLNASHISWYRQHVWYCWSKVDID